MKSSVLNSDKNLYINYFKYVSYYAYKLTGDHEYSEDLAHDAFTSYYLNKGKISENPNAIKSFLYTSVRNKLYNEHKRLLVNRRYWDKTGFNEIDSLDLDRLIIQNELLEEIDKLVNSLPRMCQQVIKLSFFDGLSNNEIKEKLNISINTVKTHKKRGLNYIQQHLNTEHYLLLLIYLT